MNTFYKLYFVVLLSCTTAVTTAQGLIGNNNGKSPVKPFLQRVDYVQQPSGEITATATFNVTFVQSTWLFTNFFSDASQITPEVTRFYASGGLQNDGLDENGTTRRRVRGNPKMLLGFYQYAGSYNDPNGGNRQAGVNGYSSVRQGYGRWGSFNDYLGYYNTGLQDPSKGILPVTSIGEGETQYIGYAPFNLQDRVMPDGRNRRALNPNGVRVRYIARELNLSEKQNFFYFNPPKAATTFEIAAAQAITQLGGQAVHSYPLTDYNYEYFDGTKVPLDIISNEPNQKVIVGFTTMDANAQFSIPNLSAEKGKAYIVFAVLPDANNAEHYSRQSPSNANAHRWGTDNGVYNANTLATFNNRNIRNNYEANMSKISGMYFYAGVKTERITEELISGVSLSADSEGTYKGRAQNVSVGDFPKKVTYANYDLSGIDITRVTPRDTQSRTYYFNHELFYTPMDHIAYVPFLKFYYIKVKKDEDGTYANNRDISITLRQFTQREATVPAKAGTPEHYVYVGNGNGSYNFTAYGGSVPYTWNGTSWKYDSTARYYPTFTPAQGGAYDLVPATPATPERTEMRDVWIDVDASIYGPFSSVAEMVDVKNGIKYNRLDRSLGWRANVSTSYATKDAEINVTGRRSPGQGAISFTRNRDYVEGYIPSAYNKEKLVTWSFLNDTEERFTIPDTKDCEYYLIMASNYSMVSGFLEIEHNAGPLLDSLVEIETHFNIYGEYTDYESREITSDNYYHLCGGTPYLEAKVLFDENNDGKIEAHEYMLEEDLERLKLTGKWYLNGELIDEDNYIDTFEIAATEPGRWEFVVESQEGAYDQCSPQITNRITNRVFFLETQPADTCLDNGTTFDLSIYTPAELLKVENSVSSENRAAVRDEINSLMQIEYFKTIDDLNEGTKPIYTYRSTNEGGPTGVSLVTVSPTLRHVYYRISGVKRDESQMDLDECPAEGVFHFRCPWARVNPNLRARGLQIEEEKKKEKVIYRRYFPDRNNSSEPLVRDEHF